MTIAFALVPKKDFLIFFSCLFFFIVVSFSQAKYPRNKSFLLCRWLLFFQIPTPSFSSHTLHPNKVLTLLIQILNKFRDFYKMDKKAFANFENFFLWTNTPKMIQAIFNFYRVSNEFVDNAVSCAQQLMNEHNYYLLHLNANSIYLE